MNSLPQNFYYPLAVGKIMVEGAYEILGLEFVNKKLADGKFRVLLDEPVKPQNIPVGILDEFQRELIAIFGQAGGQGTALRIGRSAFRYGLRKYGTILGLSSLEYRLLPTPRRIRCGLESMSNVINGDQGKLVEVGDLPGKWVWRQSVAAQNSELSPCYLIIGVLQGFLSWASGGKYYPITCEIDPFKGAPYQIISIDQKPLD